LRAAVRATMSKRAGAERVARGFAAAGGAPAAADVVEELLSGSRAAVGGDEADEARHEIKVGRDVVGAAPPRAMKSAG
jgi:hypothetical protein